MSEALDYLLKIRPDAMRSYFDFLKKSTSHLDPKTRAIISVITKVDNQTEAGFKQYLKRALKEGVTADEIIDALFMAFPTLGLSKIVWATDILLKMELPEFNPENIGKKEKWHQVAEIDELINNKVTVKIINGMEIFIYRKNKKIHVFDNRCPHQSTLISKNDLHDLELTCPNHGWKFDLRSGKCIEKGNKPLNQYKIKIEDKYLFVCFKEKIKKND